MNTLEILSCSHDTDGRLLTAYRFGEYEFDGSIVLPKRLAKRFTAADPVATRLQSYIALAHSVYSYNLAYFDEIIVPFSLNAEEIAYFEEAFYKGLAEFRYTNGIDLARKITIRSSSSSAQSSATVKTSQIPVDDTKALLLNGGGKDGAVACELVKQLGLDMAWFSLMGNDARRKAVEASGIDNYFEVERYRPVGVESEWQYGGHKPMSMVVAMVSALVAYLDGRKYVIAANEYSSNFPNVVVDGQPINHQYTKSIESEMAIMRLFEHASIPVRYFSITRPLYELQVMKIFARYSQYHHDFLSCNTNTSAGIWCLKCPKCAFVIGALYVFDRASAESIWGPKSELYSKSSQLVDESIELINPDIKPFECIGTTEESIVLLEALLADVELTQEQMRRYERYVAAIKHRPPIALEVLNNSDNFPTKLREKIISLLENELKSSY